MWVLTREHNEYDQHGGYYVKAWCEKPTIGQLDEAVANDEGGCGVLDLHDLYEGNESKMMFDVSYQFFEEM